MGLKKIKVQGSTAKKLFLSISPTILFRFDCGEGTVENLYTGPLKAGVWHKLSVRRKYCSESEVQVDEQRALHDEIPELNNYKGIVIEEGLFIGGVPSNITNLDARTGSDRTFRGQIKRVIINGLTVFDSAFNINLAVNNNGISYNAYFRAVFYSSCVILEVIESNFTNRISELIESNVD
ncbi:hypothetical protein AB6A40_009271 [Gnathostoma spinigerum]|uniref:Laminin G domain-containing protein n=1 Tax=Gnathostoma spinigerum TaxID=75299 RepID=A0ABD6F0C7_9BILA